MLIQFLLKVQIYNKHNNTWWNLYHTRYQPETPISALGPTALGLILESRVDNGVWYRFCHVLFSIYNETLNISIAEHLPSFGYVFKLIKRCNTDIIQQSLFLSLVQHNYVNKLLDINTPHIDIPTLQINIIHLVCTGQKYATNRKASNRICSMLI